MKLIKTLSQKTGETFTVKRDCEEFNTCFINTKTTKFFFNSENYKMGVYLHNIYKNGK